MAEHTTDEHTVTRRPRTSRQGWLALAIAGVVVVVTALAITPFIVANVEMSNARAEFDIAAAELDSVRVDLDGAAAEFIERVNTAKVEYELLRGVDAALPVELVDSASDRDAFLRALAAFIEATGLELDDLGAVIGAQTEQLFAAVSTPKAEDTAVELREQSVSVLSDAADAALATADLQRAKKAVDDSLDDVISSLEVLRAASHRKGLTIAFEKAGDPERTALTAAVAALDPMDASPLTLEETVALLKSYATSYSTAKNSHDVTVAAEAKAAEVKAAEEAEQQRRSIEQSSRQSSSDATSPRVEPPRTGRTEAEFMASRPRGEIIRTDFPCMDGGGSSVSSSWWSFNPAPKTADAVWVEFENRGINWGIRWTCPAD